MDKIGPKADLRRADLRRADLREANLRWADLSWADLSWADLRRADLRWADLRGADLSWADLRWADLRGAKGFQLLTTTDHGYLVYATLRGTEWRIIAGCHDFTVAEAREHWGADSYHTPSSGRRILATLDWLEKEIVPLEGRG